MHGIGFVLGGMPKRSRMKCEKCGVTKDVVRYHQRTQYVKEHMNWVSLCPKCQVINDEYWDSRWEDYYRGCM
jgi:hypothetical protein